MPDVYSSITEADPQKQRWLAEVLELRAGDPQQRAMVESYMDDLDPSAGRLLEVGCGPGAVARLLAEMPGVESVTGVDSGELFIDRARELADDERLRFLVGDARKLEFPDESFDAVVFHNTLCHIPECERVLAEARRVVRPGGSLTVFDGDYVSATVAIREEDPLQKCMDAFVSLIHDPWLMRRIRPLLEGTGLTDVRLRGHSFVQHGTGYILTLVEHGANVLTSNGELPEPEAEALKAEARSRIEAGSFLGQIGYLSATARRP
jgi:ubiquinone/menaquinone biosynthesis C-methylase UbiE